MSIRPIRHRSLHEHLVEELRRLIVSGALVPGAKINEKQLCDRFEVSRTPLREAMKSLAAEGLVRITPRRGARVTEITLAELDEAFPVLGALEALAGELACARARETDLRLLRLLQEKMTESHDAGDLEGYFRLNRKIHETLFRIAGNETLLAMRETLDRKLRRARYMANLSPARWAAAVEEHAAMLGALEARDGPLLARLMRAHLANKHAALVEALSATAEAG